VLVELAGTGVPAPETATATVLMGDPDLAVRVGWPDGVVTKLDIESYGSSVPVVQ
jgi:hypothetical protein